MSQHIEQLIEIRRDFIFEGLEPRAQTAPLGYEEHLPSPFGHLSMISTLFCELGGLLLGLAEVRLPPPLKRYSQPPVRNPSPCG